MTIAKTKSEKRWQGRIRLHGAGIQLDGSGMLGRTRGARQSGPDSASMSGTQIASSTSAPRKRGLAMVTGLETEQRQLAEFIRAGSARGPQCFGSYFDDKGGSCALGAVYEGVYH
ncbi:MAG: hypothetical protein M3Q85_04650, partial [Acidobacteriota bacterium]|nr:hypothetical protein [Acidobacteriota bacterium]